MKVYNVKEIADLLGTNPETVRRWIRGGRLGADQESRKGGNTVTEEDLAAFLKKNPKYASLARRSNIMTEGDADDRADEPRVLTIMPEPDERTVREASEASMVEKAPVPAPAKKTSGQADAFLETAADTKSRDREVPRDQKKKADKETVPARRSRVLAFLTSSDRKEDTELGDQIREREMLIAVKKRAVQLLKEQITELERENQSVIEQTEKRI